MFVDLIIFPCIIKTILLEATFRKLDQSSKTLKFWKNAPYKLPGKWTICRGTWDNVFLRHLRYKIKNPKEKNANFDLFLEDENTITTFEICLIFKKILAWVYFLQFLLKLKKNICNSCNYIVSVSVAQVPGKRHR